MYCPNCSSAIPPQSSFCLHCGKPVPTHFSPVQQSSPQRQSWSALTIIVAVLLGSVVFVVCISIGLSLAYSLHSGGSRTNNSPSLAQTLAGGQTVVVNKTFPVGARQYSYFKFSIPTSAHIEGHFTAQGGSNDIQVMLFTEDGFTNFENGHPGSIYYQSSGYVTTDTIDKHIPAGSYCLVFSNTKSLLTNKVVTANVVANY
jgi:hypothetical protein